MKVKARGGLGRRTTGSGRTQTTPAHTEGLRGTPGAVLPVGEAADEEVAPEDPRLHGGGPRVRWVQGREASPGRQEFTTKVGGKRASHKLTGVVFCLRKLFSV